MLSRVRPLMALPTMPSVPYTMAVSMKLTPRSSAACTSAIDCASVSPVPSPMRLLPPQPSPATLTLRPVLPSVVYCIRVPPSEQGIEQDLGQDRAWVQLCLRPIRSAGLGRLGSNAVNSDTPAGSYAGTDIGRKAGTRWPAAGGGRPRIASGPERLTRYL